MTQQKKEPEPCAEPSVHGNPSKKKRLKVIPGETSGDPSKLKPTTARIIAHEGERLTPQELKERFANNLDRLLGIVGLTRRDAAVEIGISYPLLKRLVTAGVSLVDERNLKRLSRIQAFFTLERVEDLWLADLIPRLLVAGQNAFLEKFQTQMLAVREKRLVESGPIRREELALLNRALGFEETPTPSLTGPYAVKVLAILASPKAEAFGRVIDDYHEFATLATADHAEKSNESERNVC